MWSSSAAWPPLHIPAAAPLLSCGRCHSACWHHALACSGLLLVIVLLVGPATPSSRPLPPLPEQQLRTIRRRLNASTTVAVIGSSGNLHQRGNGRAIDQHDLVLRMNNAPTKGYEDDVGRFTHIRVLWPGALRAARGVLQSEAVVLTCPVRGQCRWEHQREMAGVHPAAVIDNAWKALVHRRTLRGRGKFPSTGFVALAVAVAMVQRVGGRAPSVYGFGACARCLRYYDCHGTNSSDESERSGKNAWHPFEEEAVVRRIWHEQGWIRLVEPSCDVLHQRHA